MACAIIRALFDFHLWVVRQPNPFGGCPTLFFERRCVVADEDEQVSMTYERKLTDGNYGSEGVSLSWSGTRRELRDPGAILADLRRQALDVLAHSASERVAGAARRELAFHD